MIVDTSVWINYLAGIEDPQTNWLVHQLSEPEIGLTDLILCEVLQGVLGDAAFLRTQHRLSDFSIFSTAGEGLAIASAKNYRFCGLAARRSATRLIVLSRPVASGMGIHCCIMIVTSMPSRSTSASKSSIRSTHKPERALTSVIACADI